MIEDNFSAGDLVEAIRASEDLSKQGANEASTEMPGCMPRLKDISPHFPGFENLKVNEQKIYRPIQYLGNKLRTIPDIIRETQKLGIYNSQVYDLFSGTSVVSQAFAHLGHQVTAVDTQLYSRTIATALLGVNRADEESLTEACLKIAHKATCFDLDAPWAKFIQQESLAIEANDARRLNEIYSILPTLWKPTDDFEPLKLLKSKSEGGAAGIVPVIALTLAGSYFGIKQAIALDSLRWAIADFAAGQQISTWQTAALLTALMAAMSEAVYSAGKHFAQPLTAGVARNERFRQQRMLKDRSIDITEIFLKASFMVDTHARNGSEGHAALAISAERAIGSSKQNPKLVYADPPYTAQQYSRFYHALETIISYQIPTFSPATKMTSGLYPPDRYKSAFSSKRNAPDAFGRMISTCALRGANLLLSYSISSSESDGNQRIISLERLLEICSLHYHEGRIDVVEMSHMYRQFNSASRSNVLRNDPELLIVCRP